MSISNVSNQEKNEYEDYLREIVTLEAIHKIIEKKSTKYLCSLRVVAPTANPQQQQQQQPSAILFGSRGLTVGSGSLSGDSANLAPNATFATIQTVSSFANDPNFGDMLSRFTSGHQSQNTLSLLTGMLDIGDTNLAPRLLLTYTNLKDEFYECQLTYEELLSHREEMSLENMSWKSYIQHLHNGMRSVAASPNAKSAGELEVFFDEENKTSQDILTIAILSPLNEHVKLKYSYELYAVRDPSDFSDKMCSLVFDLASFTETLYYTRENEDKKLIAELSKQLRESRERIDSLENRISLLQPATAAAQHLDYLGEASGSTGTTNSKGKTRAGQELGKRKAPKSLLNPTHKRKAPRGAKIISAIPTPSSSQSSTQQQLQQRRPAREPEEESTEEEDNSDSD